MRTFVLAITFLPLILIADDLLAKAATNFSGNQFLSTGHPVESDDPEESFSQTDLSDTDLRIGLREKMAVSHFNANLLKPERDDDLQQDVREPFAVSSLGKVVLAIERREWNSVWAQIRSLAGTCAAPGVVIFYLLLAAYTNRRQRGNTNKPATSN